MKEGTPEVKEISMDELKSMLTESVKELLPDLKSEIIAEVKPSLTEGKQAETTEEKTEKAAQFVKDLCMGNLEQKATDSTTGSFGYTIPTELASEILAKRDKLSKMRKLAFQFTAAGPFQLPTEGTGVTSYWVAENTAITESSPTVAKKDLVDYYLATYVKLPRKLLNTSAFNITEFISNLCARSIVRTEETAFVAGDGSAKPTGLRTTSGVNSVAQAGANLAYDDMVNLFYLQPEQYRQNVVWMTSTNGLKLLRKLKDTQGLPIFDIRDNTIFGHPVYENTDIPANLGGGTNETEIWLFDPFYYWIKDGEQMFADTHKIISSLQVELVVAEATDGIYVLPEAASKLTAVK